MWKRLSLVLFALILTFTVSADTVIVWSPWTVEWNRVIQKLTDEEFTPKTGIEVKIVAIPAADMETKLLLAAASGDVPDIGITGSLGPADLGVRGAAVDLYERFSNQYLAVRDDMYPGLMRSFEFRGTNFGLPADTALYPMAYRTDILSEMGMNVPVTWKELYGILPKLQANGYNFAPTWGFADGVGNVAYADVSMFIWQHGGDWYSEDRTRSGLDCEESIAGFIEYAELYTKHNIPKAVDGFMGFKNGELPLLQISSTQYSYIKTAAPELTGKWKVTVVPGTVREDGTISHAAYIGGSTFVMFKASKKQDEAFAWLKWWLSTETQTKYINEVPKALPGSVVIPANRHAMLNMPLPEEDVEAYMLQASHSIAPAYALAPESITHRFINNACAKAVLQGVDPVEAILEAASLMNVELEKKQKEYARFISKLN